MIKQVPVTEFKYGLLDSIEDTAIPRGSSSKSLNWITEGVKIALRRGYDLLGTTENSGVGRITGLGVARKPNGDNIVYRTRKRKLEYLDTTTDDWVEVGSDVLPAAVVATDSLGEDISFEAYTNVTGEQIRLNSKNAGPHKIMTANPGSITDMFVLGTNYKGKMRVKNGRQYVWDRAGNPPNKIDLFASKLDVKGSADYTQISSEAVAGTGTNISGTLAFKAGGARRICFEVTFERDTSAETFTDNGDGTLTSTAGGTGTINYTTGAFALVFASAAAVVTATYRWADDSSGGIDDFNFSATRTAGQGFILKQAGGGAFRNLASLNGVEYCLHESKTWAVTISTDDLDVSNLIFRNKVGIPSERASVETADGIYYIDDTDENDPHFRVLSLESLSTEVVPKSVSKQFKIADVKVGVNLKDYRFDKGASIEFGDLVLFACRTKDSDANNRVFVYNKVNKATDILDYYVSQFALYEGTLIAGDSITDNVYTLFSGTDDNQSLIGNYWESSLDNLGHMGMKRVVELTVDGEIGPEQQLKISMSVDRGPFVQVRSPYDVTNDLYAIQGDGDYVDKAQRVSVGAFTLGRGEVGGGGSGVEAYHYRRSFRISLDKFEYAKFKVEAVGLGYASVSEFTFRDVRIKWTRPPNKYRLNR
jgi:hypothetical protein